MSERVYQCTIVNPISIDQLDLLPNHFIGVNSDGSIAFLGGAAQADALRTQYPRHFANLQCHENQFLMPGLVDTHCHGPQYTNIGTGTDLPLLEWLEKYTFPTEARFADTAVAEKIYRQVVRMTLRHGTTTACYFATIHAASSKLFARIVAELGQRALIGKVCMDRNSPPTYCESSAAESMRATRDVVEFIETLANDRVEAVLTPRFVPSCTSELMSALGALAKEKDLFVQSHVSENKAEIEWVRSLHPESESYTDVYRRHGLLNKRTILAHAVHVTDDELQLFRDADAAIAHCPNSNFVLRSGVMNVRRILAAQVKLGLGTDMSGGYSPSIWDAMRQAIIASTVHAVADNSDDEPLSYTEAFYLGTLGGARALDLDDKIGSFAPGKQFDALLLDPRANNNIDIEENKTAQEIFQKLFYLADDRNISKVFVQGKQIDLQK